MEESEVSMGVGPLDPVVEAGVVVVPAGGGGAAAFLAASVVVAPGAGARVSDVSMGVGPAETFVTAAVAVVATAVVASPPVGLVSVGTGVLSLTGICRPLMAPYDPCPDARGRLGKGISIFMAVVAPLSTS